MTGISNRIVSESTNFTMIAGFYSTILKAAYQESQNIKVLKNDSLFGIILKVNKAVLQ